MQSIREQQVQLRYYSVKAPADGMMATVRVAARCEWGPVPTSPCLPPRTPDRGGQLSYVYVRRRKLRRRTRMLGTFVDNEGKPMLRTKGFHLPPGGYRFETLLLKTQLPNADPEVRNPQQVNCLVNMAERKAR